MVRVLPFVETRRLEARGRTRARDAALTEPCRENLS